MKLAIPNKGRLSEPVLELLERAGIRVSDGQERRLYGKTNIAGLTIVFARSDDIPLYVESGAADAGITGLDAVIESQAEVETILKLGVGACSIKLAIPESSDLTIKQLDGNRIATKLPNITKKFFKERGIDAAITELSGAIELAPKLSIADAIVDHVSTGTTLAVNGLKAIATIMDSEAILIAKQQSEMLDELRLALEGVITAEKKRYVMANVTTEEALKRVVAVMPCMESPTVLKLAKEGEYAVHSVIDEAELMPAIRKLKEAGARDILVFGMGRVIP